MDRVPFGVPGLDPLLQGGIPKGNSILVCGTPGTGKTIFALQFLYIGATQFNDRGMYVSIEEDPEDLKKQALQFGWDFRPLEEKGMVRFIKVPIDTVNTDIFKMIGDAYVQMNDVRRIVIDSLSILSINASMYTLPIKTMVDGKPQFMENGLVPSPMTLSDETKQFIYLFVSKVSELGATTFFIGDSPEKGSDFITRDTVSEFVCDGVIKLETKEFGKTIIRTIEIKKMRSTKAEVGYHTLEFTEKGIMVKPFEY